MIELVVEHAGQTELVVERAADVDLVIGAPAAVETLEVAGGGGPPGPPGPSAYQVAVAQGFVGSEAAWLATLVGPSGQGDAPDFTLLFENGLV